MAPLLKKKAIKSPRVSVAKVTMIYLFRGFGSPLNAPQRWLGRSRDAEGGRPYSVPPPFWLRCRRGSCLEEMGTGNERIWSFRDPISWVCEWRQNRTLNLNFKKVCGVKMSWPSPGRGRFCCCYCCCCCRCCCTSNIVSPWEQTESHWL